MRQLFLEIRLSHFVSVFLLFFICLFGISPAHAQSNIPSQLEFDELPPDYNTYLVRVKEGQGMSLTGHLDVPSSYKGRPVTVIWSLSSAISSVSIPSSIIRIEDNGFAGSPNLKSIVIPNTVKEVGIFAFKACGSLSSVVTSPANEVRSSFSGCDIIKGAYPEGKRSFVADCEVAYPNSCIPQSSGLIFNSNSTVFYFAPWDIEMLELPKSVSTIGPKALAKCTKLNKLILNSPVPPTVSDDAFDGANIKSILVPAGCKDSYAKSPGWSGFASKITEDVRPQRVEIITEVSKIRIGDSLQLEAEIYPENALIKDISWKVSDPEVATVSNTGYLETKSVGTSDIYVIVTDVVGNNIQGHKTLVVSPVFVESIMLLPQKKNIVSGETIRIESRVLPENATNRMLKWTSSDDSIASVDDSGNVTGHKKGNCTIQAEAMDGSGVVGSCYLSIYNRMVESISFDITRWYGDIESQFQIVATVLPENANEKALKWSSSDETIATVDDNGLVTTHNIGSCFVTAESIDGSKVASSCYVCVEGLKLSPSSWTGKIGESFRIDAMIFSKNNSEKVVEWKSSNETVATVDENGSVRAISPGTAVVTAISEDGYRADCKVTVIEEPVTEVPVSGVEIDWKLLGVEYGKLNVKVGESVTFMATVLPVDATDKSLIWTSSNPDVAKIDENGVMTALSSGTAIITVATINGFKDECSVVVEEAVSPEVPVSGIIIDKDALGFSEYGVEMQIGEVKEIKAVVEPDNASDKSLVYESSSPEVVSIDGYGRMRALRVGSSRIMITASNGVFESFSVFVVNYPPQEIRLNLSEADLKIGETVRLEANVLPENAADRSVTWTSDDDGVASVDDNGLVTALSLGEAVITATTVNGIVAECKVKVSATSVTGVVIDKDALGITGDNLSMRVGESKTFKVTVVPDDATDKSIRFESSAPQIVSIDENGNLIAKSLGDAVISAIASNGVSASINVVVVATLAESVSLNITEAVLKSGETVQLEATVLPEDTTDKSVSWSTSDSVIVSIDDSGLVKAAGIGTAVVTVTTTNGLTAECRIDVVPTEVTGVVIDKVDLGIEDGRLEMRVGDTKTVKVTLEPWDATDKSVGFDSSAPEVVSVDGNGRISALMLGEATVTATAGSGVSDSFTVVVVATPAESVSLNLEMTSLRAGETVQLEARVLPENTTDKNVKWSTSDDKVAVVDASGMVTAVSIGEAVVSATTANGLTAECRLTVEKTNVTGVFIDRKALGITGNRLEMLIGESKKIVARVEPEDATDKTIRFSSTDPEVVTIDEAGNFKALSVGYATISALAGHNAYDNIYVFVSAISEETVTINLSEVELKAGETVQLTATVLPEDATDRSVRWSSSLNGVATVDKNGLVTAVGVGDAVITAISANRLTAECKVRVVKTPVSGIVIDKEALGIIGNELEMKVGEYKSIIATVEPENATDKSLRIESSDDSVVRVSGNGYGDEIRAYGVGVADVTITAMSGVSTTIKVWVYEEKDNETNILVNSLKYHIDRDARTATVSGDGFYSGGDVVIPDAVTYFGNDYRVTEIEDSAFYNRSSLRGELRIGGSVSRIGKWAFAGCSGLTGNLVIPNSVKSLGEGAFMNCSGFDGTLSISSNIEAVEDLTFCVCSGLKGNLRIPDTVKKIGVNAFRSSGFDGELILSSSLSEIGSNAFYGCHFSGALVIPDSVTEIGDYAFNWNEGFPEGLILPEGLSKIGDGAFSNCSEMGGELKLPESLVEIGKMAFYRCSGFSGDLRIPDSVVTIGNGAFSDCAGFSGSLTIGNSLREIGGTVFMQCKGFSGKLIVGESVEVIRNGAFYGVGFESVELPASLKEIEDNGIWFTAESDKRIVICRASVPPVSNGNPFYSGQVRGTLYVPVLSIDVYKEKWYMFRTVKGIEGEIPKGVVLNIAEKILVLNENVQLQATVLPEDSYDKTVTWSSSDTTVATVDEDGVVTAVSAGVAVITATSVNGMTANCVITVENSELGSVTGVDDSGESLSVLLTPEGITIKGVSLVDSVVEVYDLNGRVIAACKVNGGECFSEKYGAIALVKGIYVVRVNSRNGSLTKKVNVK